MRVEIPASWFVVIWYRSAEMKKQRCYKSTLIPEFFYEHFYIDTQERDTYYIHFLFPFIPVSMSGTPYICAEQRYQGRTESPRAK